MTFFSVIGIVYGGGIECRSKAIPEDIHIQGQAAAEA